MPCTPILPSNFSPPPSGVGGLAPSIPPLNIPFPDQPLQDLLLLFESIFMISPVGIIRVNFEPDVLNDVYQGINDLLKKIFPFLMIYQFFLPVLELILCIIEILCSLLNPVKLRKQMNILFRVCIPAFLSLFPQFAIIILILTLLQLLLTLIEYLLGRIVYLLLIIIENIIILSKAIQRADNDSVIAITKKVGDLLCLLQNLFAILGVFNLIIQIIKALLSLTFKIPPCSDSNPNSCCSPDVCPEFIKNNTDIISSDGYFLYYNEVGLDSGLILPPGFPPIVSVIRNESWQFYDPSLSQNQAFINITKAFDLPAGINTVFFPSGATFTETSPSSSAPYTITFTALYNPTVFQRTDPLGVRNIQIVSAIVVAPPTAGVLSYNGTTYIPPNNGTLNLIGGTVQETSGTPIINPSTNVAYTVNEFFHLPTNINGEIPLPTDGILFSNISYDFNINHDVLIASGLITVGCAPDVAANKNFINATIGAQFNTNSANLENVVLPDVNAAQECVINALATYRNNISEASTNAFQTTMTNCLTQLQNETNAAISSIINAGYDPYTSTFTVEPSIQFTTVAIVVSVSLNEASGNLMTNNLTPSVAALLAPQITANITFGSITPFVYDGYQFFTADITSDIDGNGTVQIAFDNSFISVLNNPTDTTQTPSVSITTTPYTFVSSPAISAPGVGEPRRDPSDIARDGDI